jgi:hypothetical protein
MDKWEYLQVVQYEVSSPAPREIVFSVNGKTTQDQATSQWDNAPEWHSYVASLGDQGWELVAVADARWVFKRRKP